MSLKFLNEYRIIKEKLGNWMRVILILNINWNFEVKEIGLKSAKIEFFCMSAATCQSLQNNL